MQDHSPSGAPCGCLPAGRSCILDGRIVSGHQPLRLSAAQRRPVLRILPRLSPVPRSDRATVRAVW
jgi:hypothetical protein